MVLQITDETISDLAGFSITLNVDQKGTGLQFTGADKTTSDPFIFQPDDGLTYLLGFGSLTLTVDDYVPVTPPPGVVNLGPGTYGLARVFYQANQNGEAAVSFDTTVSNPGNPGSIATLLSKGDGSTITAADYESGEQTINITAVPEPPTLISCSTAGLLGLAYSWRRRKTKVSA